MKLRNRRRRRRHCAVLPEQLCKLEPAGQTAGARRWEKWSAAEPGTGAGGAGGRRARGDDRADRTSGQAIVTDTDD